MYFTSKLTAEQLKIVKSDDDIHRSYDLIIMLSNDFKSDSSIAKQLDEHLLSNYCGLILSSKIPIVG
jgi:hypothetical protein